MSKFDFDNAMNFVLRWEGGFVDHPEDPGGATNHGISGNRNGLTYEQVKNLTVDPEWVDPMEQLMPEGLPFELPQPE